MGQPGRLRLDLSGLSFIDPVGIAALGRLMAKRITVRGGSPFINELLKECLS
jgi:hypothetical protein